MALDNVRSKILDLGAETVYAEVTSSAATQASALDQASGELITAIAEQLGAVAEIRLDPERTLSVTENRNPPASRRPAPRSGPSATS